MSESPATDQITNLRSVPLFAELSDEVLADIAARATSFEASEGHVLVQPNHAGAGLFIIEEGSVTVETSGRKVELGPGEFFGELALLDEGATHAARVCAASPVRCLALRRDDFDDLLATQPRLAIAMLKTVARRLARTSAH
jgi:voltage-gated potassium channel